MFSDLAWLVYFGDVSDSIRGFFLFGVVISLVCAAIIAIHAAMRADIMSYRELKEHREEQKGKFLLQWKFLTVAFVLAFIGSFIPTKQTIYIFAGAQVVDRIAADPKMQQLGGRVYELIEKKIESELNDLSPKKEAPKEEEKAS